MPKNTLMVVTEILIEEEPKLSLEELCASCQVTPEFIQDLIEYGVIDLDPMFLKRYEFDTEHLKRVRTVLRLQRDLEVNLAGAAVVLDMMDQMEEMRQQLEIFEKYLLS